MPRSALRAASVSIPWMSLVTWPAMYARAAIDERLTALLARCLLAMATGAKRGQVIHVEGCTAGCQCNAVVNVLGGRNMAIFLAALTQRTRLQLSFARVQP